MNMQNISLTVGADKRLNYLLNNDAVGKKLRIKVTGGGCSGFQYIMDFTDDYNVDEDMLIADKVIVDPISLNFLNNAIIDYVETLGYASFEIKNPNASAKCGCGNSFAINMDDI